MELETPSATPNPPQASFSAPATPPPKPAPPPRRCPPPPETAFASCLPKPRQSSRLHHQALSRIVCLAIYPLPVIGNAW